MKPRKQILVLLSLVIISVLILTPVVSAQDLDVTYTPEQGTYLLDNLHHLTTHPVNPITDLLQTNSTISDVFRLLTYKALKGFASLADGAYDAVKKLLTFDTHLLSFGKTSALSAAADSLLVPLLVIMLCFTAVKIMTRSDRSIGEVVRPLLVSALFAFGALALFWFGNQIQDYGMADLNPYLSLDEAGFGTHLLSNYVYDMEESVKSGTLVRAVDVGADITRLDGREIIQSRDGLFGLRKYNVIGGQYLYTKSSDGIFGMFKESTYKYSYQMLQPLIFMLCTLTVLAFAGFKIVRLLFDLMFKRIIYTPVAVTSGESGRTKLLVTDVLTSYITILFVFILLIIYMDFAKFLSDKTITGEVGPYTAILFMVGSAWSVIDGPEIVPKLFGQDAGVQSAFAAIKLMQAGLQATRSVMRMAAVPLKAAHKIGSSLSNNMRGALSSHGADASSSKGDAINSESARERAGMRFDRPSSTDPYSTTPTPTRHEATTGDSSRDASPSDHHRPGISANERRAYEMSEPPDYGYDPRTADDLNAWASDNDRLESGIPPMRSALDITPPDDYIPFSPHPAHDSNFDQIDTGSKPSERDALPFKPTPSPEIPSRSALESSPASESRTGAKEHPLQSSSPERRTPPPDTNHDQVDPRSTPSDRDALPFEPAPSPEIPSRSALESPRTFEPRTRAKEHPSQSPSQERSPAPIPTSSNPPRQTRAERNTDAIIAESATPKRSSRSKATPPSSKPTPARSSSQAPTSNRSTHNVRNVPRDAQPPATPPSGQTPPSPQPRRKRRPRRKKK